MFQFEFAGNKYRVAFRHDPPPQHLSRHEGHDVEIERIAAKNGRSRLPATLICLSCSTEKNLVILAPLSRKPRARRTVCFLKQYVEVLGWCEIAAAAAKVNLHAGDRFNKRDGRRESFKKLRGEIEKREADQSQPAGLAASIFADPLSEQLAKQCAVEVVG